MLQSRKPTRIYMKPGVTRTSLFYHFLFVNGKWNSQGSSSLHHSPRCYKARQKPCKKERMEIKTSESVKTNHALQWQSANMCLKTDNQGNIKRLAKRLAHLRFDGSTMSQRKVGTCLAVCSTPFSMKPCCWLTCSMWLMPNHVLHLMQPLDNASLAEIC